MMDPVIHKIYEAYFNQDQWRVLGLADEFALASALQMQAHRAMTEMWSSYNVTAAHDHTVYQQAYKFVRHYLIATP